MTATKEQIEVLVKKHQKMVYKIVNKIRPSYDFHKEDLVLAGFLGLVIGANRYNPDSNIKPSTFLHHYIFGYVHKFIGEQDQAYRCAYRKKDHANRKIATGIFTDIDLQRSKQTVEEIKHAEHYIRDYGFPSKRWAKLPFTEEGYGLFEQREDLARLISTLPLRDALIMECYCADYETKEIAKICELTTTSIATIIRNSTNALTEIIDKEKSLLLQSLNKK